MSTAMVLMKKDKTIIGIIPARGGSKGLPGKNIREFCGKPLIAFSIDAALSCKYLNKVIVTTDSHDIADIAKKHGAEVPFLRPVELAADNATTASAVSHALNFYKEEFNEVFDFVVLLQPTSPLRTSLDIDAAIDMLLQKNADAAISVCEMKHPPQWSNTLPDDLSMKDFLPEEIKGKRRQDLPTYFRANGAIYICKVEKFLERQSFYLTENIYAYVMKEDQSVDIDTEIDFKLAELIFQAKTKFF